ncbi:hypothetical protein ACR6C2_08330 [Streptomyces sp. INA 01156]
MTAGPDERTLQVIPGGAGVDQPVPDDRDGEERVRQDLLRLMSVGPYAAAGPPPPYPPTVPAPSAPVDVDQEPEEGADHEGFSDWLRDKRAARQEPQDPEPDDDGEPAARPTRPTGCPTGGGRTNRTWATRRSWATSLPRTTRTSRATSPRRAARARPPSPRSRSLC